MKKIFLFGIVFYCSIGFLNAMDESQIQAFNNEKTDLFHFENKMTGEDCVYSYSEDKDGNVKLSVTSEQNDKNSESILFYFI